MYTKEELQRKTQGDLANIAMDYQKRLKMIGDILMNYGTISNDDLIGLITKAIPSDLM